MQRHGTIFFPILLAAFTACGWGSPQPVLSEEGISSPTSKMQLLAPSRESDGPPWGELPAIYLPQRKSTPLPISSEEMVSHDPIAPTFAAMPLMPGNFGFASPPAVVSQDHWAQNSPPPARLTNDLPSRTTSRLSSPWKDNSDRMLPLPEVENEHPAPETSAAFSIEPLRDRIAATLAKRATSEQVWPEAEKNPKMAVESDNEKTANPVGHPASLPDPQEEDVTNFRESPPQSRNSSNQLNLDELQANILGNNSMVRKLRFALGKEGPWTTDRLAPLVLRIEQVHRRHHDLMLIYGLTSDAQKNTLDSPDELDSLVELIEQRLTEALEYIKSPEFEGSDDQRLTERLILDQLEKTVASLNEVDESE